MRELLRTENPTAPCPACGSLEIVHGFGPVCAVCGSQFTEHEPRPGDSYLKHVGSWLLDLPVRISYDDETKTPHAKRQTSSGKLWIQRISNQLCWI